MSGYCNTMKHEKNIIISGGSGYLGSAIVEKCLNEGNSVVSLSRGTGKAFRQQSKLFRHISCDIGDEQSVKAVVKKIVSEFSEIHAVVHCASAPVKREQVLSESAEDFILQFSVNVFGGFYLFKHVAPFLLNGSVVIGITTKAVHYPGERMKSGSYMPAKSALSELLRTMRGELHQSGVRVCEVAPGFMPGGLNRDIPKPVMDFILRKSEPAEVTSPKEVANVITNIISGSMDTVDGKIFMLPGGELAEM